LKRLVAVLVALSPAVARADDTAALAYDQAVDLTKQNKWDQACPLFAASYKADPQLGVLLHLAECHEHVGKVASAWTEWNDAVGFAHAKGDAREKLAQQHADALKPKIARLHINVASPVAGISVRRDGVDITVLVGTDVPIDPGDHEIVVSAPGFLDWKKTVTIGTLPTVSPLDVPALEKAPDKPVETPVTPAPPAVHTVLSVFAQPGSQISIDDKPVGAGHFEGEVTPGKHTVHVTASGAKPYTNDVYVKEGENHAVEVSLESDRPYVAPAPAENLPSFELGLGFAPGIKGHGDKPVVIAYRVDAGFRLGSRVNFGAFVEYASISASNACGTDISGTTLAGPYDFGSHYQFTSCRYFMPGLQLYIHFLPKQKLDPWIGITPGFRFAFYDTNLYDGLGMAKTVDNGMFPGILSDFRVGVDYHPLPAYAAWAVGAFADLQVTFIGDENFDNSHDKGQTFVSFFGGLRSSLAF
jgi:hypothetical protein